MGTHPIFESDFDCLTEAHQTSHASDVKMDFVFKIDKDINCIKKVGTKIYFGASDKNVYEEVERGQFRIAIRHLAQVTALGCVDNAIISAGLDGHVRFITGFTFESQLPVIRCMAVNDDNIALGGPDGAISVHDHNGRLQRHWEGHSEGTVYSVLWWNEILLTSSADSDLKAWNFAKGKSKSLARKGNLHEDSLSGGHGVYCMDNHDRMLAVGGGDGKASLWHLNDNDQTGRFEINRIKVLTGHTAPINAIKFDPTGAILATASNDKTLCLWNMDGHLIRQNELHLAAILTIEWVSAGVYTGGADYSLKFTYFNTSQIEEPQHLCCPISTNLMIDAVTAEDGQVYSRGAIEAWFRKGGASSPLTNAVIGTKLAENGQMQRQVQEFIQLQIQ